MLTRSAISRLCIVGASHGRHVLANCIAATTTATGSETFLPQPTICDNNSSTSTFPASNAIRSRSSSGSRNYEQSRFAADFKLINYLGRGSYGIVCAALNKLDLQTYAVKCVPFKNQMPEILNEVRTMARIPPHQNVIRYFSSWMESASNTVHSFLYGYTTADPCQNSDSNSGSTSSLMVGFSEASQVLYIQMEHCHGSLRSWLQNRTEVDPPYAIHIFKQMAEGLRHLHSNGLLHLDVKPENCLHNGEQVFKISDFGSSRATGLALQDDASEYFGTESYAAPECREDSQSCSTKSDVYSLGLCLMELFTMFNTGMERALAFQDVRKGSFAEQWTTRWPNIAAIVKAMTMPSQDDRPTFDSLLEWSLTFTDPNPSVALHDIEQIEPNDDVD